jgi:hypothetical protein
MDKLANSMILTGNPQGCKHVSEVRIYEDIQLNCPYGRHITMITCRVYNPAVHYKFGII